jgi:glycosyltransferase involved in cell wall biosynthesis
MRRADKVIAMSEKMRDYFIENSHIPCSKFQVIDNAISVEKYENKSDDGHAVRAGLGIPPEVPLFGFIARLDPPKDHATFLRSAVQILRVDANARFLIVGDGVLRQSLQELATKLGIEKSVIFCGFRKDVPAILSAIDVLVLCSLYEGQPVSVMEAMAASRPVVATNVLGISSIVVDGKTGILVPGENPAAVADACIRLMNDSSLRQRMGQAGNIHIKARHSIAVMAQKTANLYTSLLKDRGITL